MGLNLILLPFNEKDILKILFAENIGIVLQAKDDVLFESFLKEENIEFFKLGNVVENNWLEVGNWKLDISKYRDDWFKTSYLLDQKQTKNGKAAARFANYKMQPLSLFISFSFHRSKTKY